MLDVAGERGLHTVIRTTSCSVAHEPIMKQTHVGIGETYEPVIDANCMQGSEIARLL